MYVYELGLKMRMKRDTAPHALRYVLGTEVTHQGYGLVHLDVQLNVLLVQLLQEVRAPLFQLLHLLRYIYTYVEH